MKLPILQTDQGIPQVPAPQASMQLYGAAAGAAGDLAEATGRSAHYLAGQRLQIEAEKARIRQGTEAMDLFVDASKRVNALHLALKTTPDLDEATHVSRFTTGFREIRDETLARTTDPGVRTALQRMFQRLDLEESRKAELEANAMFRDGQKAAIAQSLVHLEQQAGSADTEGGRNFYLGVAAGYLQSKRGVLSQQEIQKMQQGMTETVYGNAARRAIDANPDADVNDLLKRVPLTEQTRLAEYQVRKQDAAARERQRLQEKEEREAVKAAEAERKAAVDQLDLDADAGTLTWDRLRQAIDERVAIDTDARRLTDKLTKQREAGGRTDDAVYNALELRLLENPQSVSDAEIRRVQRSGKLAASGPRSAATLLRLTKDLGDKDITKQELFQQGLRDIRGSLRGGKGPLESLTGTEQGRLENAEREYHDIARSGKVDLTALPELARKIIDRKRKELPAAMAGDPEAMSSLRYTNPADLLAARKAGLIPDAEFNRQFQKMRELGLIKAGPSPATETPGGR